VDEHRLLKNVTKGKFQATSLNSLLTEEKTKDKQKIGCRIIQPPEEL